MSFKVDLDIFAGPLDLLLYLVKKHEVDVTEVPIAKVTEEFVAYLEVLEELAIDQVGEFVELASVLLEIKARALVPRPEEQEEGVCFHVLCLAGEVPEDRVCPRILYGHASQVLRVPVNDFIPAPFKEVSGLHILVVENST